MEDVSMAEITIVKTEVINRFVVNISEYKLNEYAVLMIDCYFDDKYVLSVSYRLPNDVFEGWGEDDNYIDSYVEAHLKEIIESNTK
tara:strand:+ start:1544 stop:1801 length:258 start_codon:yes stop_codon:yes gene_type:complete